ncbi:interleukin-27 subunit beta [Pseudoliparis swirei]|uniref:interleukin-27 subunit beta n=1 Tax=Pseudoliparis swirei TaxID=2059687 RepID=UPI0024BDACC2|nr:interleukin-27 subunit beta [Pseudoliparis swirei]
MALGGVCVALTLLVCVLGGQTLDLPRRPAASEDPPSSSSDPPSTPSVGCWCASYPNVTLCSWPEAAGSPPTRYVATYSERRRQLVTKPCRLIRPGSASSDLTPAPTASSQRVPECQLPDLKLLTDYVINVTAVSAAGSSSRLSSFMLEDIVKPDPPVEVRVSPPGTRGLLVEWSPPPTWTNLDIFPLKYQIRYRWEIRGSQKSATLGPFESTRVELKGLASGRTYRLQVCAQDLLGLGACSNWSSPVDHVVPRATPWRRSAAL